MTGSHASDLQLDALRLGQLDSAERMDLLGHIERCDACRARKTLLDDGASGFAARFDTMRLAGEALASLANMRPDDATVPWWRKAGWFGAAVATAGVALFLFVEAPSGVRTKGPGQVMEVFVLEGDAPQPTNGMVPRRARLVVRYNATGSSHLRFLWDSGPDGLSALYPRRGASALSPREVGAQFLDREIALDGSPHTERLVGTSSVTSVWAP